MDGAWRAQVMVLGGGFDGLNTSYVVVDLVFDIPSGRVVGGGGTGATEV
jgi:hypothetical protein